MKTPIDNSTKKVFRNARIRSYGKVRACINYDNAKIFKSNPAAIMLIKRASILGKTPSDIARILTEKRCVSVK